MRRSSLAVLLLALTGCVTVQKEKGHDRVAQLVQERAGVQTGWDRGTPEAEAIAKRVNSLLEGGLTSERAVEIALLNNPSLQETYEELGVSQADLIEAGLLENPTLDLSLGFPVSGGSLNEWEGGLVANFLNLFMLPLRKSVAEEQFVTDTLRVAHQALGTVAEVQKALVAVQLNEQLLELSRAALEASESAADLSARQHRAGNITDLELSLQQVTYEQARADATERELAVVSAREQVNRLLGLWGPNTSWTLAAELAALPTEEPALEHLETLAIRQRLDVIAARQQSALFARGVSIASDWRLFGTVEVGIHAHQDADGPRLFGPTLTLELPIFHQRQATIARLEAQQRMSERRLAALSVDARSEVRELHARYSTARRLATHLKNVVLPLRDRVLQSSMLQYNAMQVGLYALLDAKRDQLSSYEGYLRALGDYWSARAELERAVGGRITSSSPSQPEAVKP